MPVSPVELENSLRDLPRSGALIKDRGYRQVWRFERDGQAYYLKFYPRVRPFRRLLRGSPALREFFRLQWLQKAGIPAPRPVAVLNGFRLSGRSGDAVVLEAIEPSVGLDKYLNQFQLQGTRAPNHHALARQMIEIIYQLGAAHMGHDDLHLGNFLLKEGRLHLIDAHAVHRGGLKMRDVLQLAHAVRGYATRTDLRRGWIALKSDTPLPTSNPVSQRWWRTARRRVMGENRYFGKWKMKSGQKVQSHEATKARSEDKVFPLSFRAFMRLYRRPFWSCHYFKQFKYPQRGFPASGLVIGSEDWRTAWAGLLEKIELDQLEVLKRTRSGDVLGGEIVLGGATIPFILKRPRRKHWYRYINEIGRGGRARRAWKKAWSLIARDIPTAWPLALMERRILGYVVDQIILFERVPGVTLDQCDLDTLPADARYRLFARAGRLLRRLEEDGLYHYDAKSSNWIVRPDDRLGPTPVLIDVDGIRRVRWIALGIQRLLLSMRDHPQYTPADSLALCRGYAPFAPIGLEEIEEEDQEDEETTTNIDINPP
jgi:tRNA A-37 threonylcarbamoyl transferase component Bud32